MQGSQAVPGRRLASHRHLRCRPQVSARCVFSSFDRCGPGVPPEGASSDLDPIPSACSMSIWVPPRATSCMRFVGSDSSLVNFALLIYSFAGVHTTCLSVVLALREQEVSACPCQSS